MAHTTAQGPIRVDPEPGRDVDLIPREFLRVIAVWSLVPAYLAAGAFFGWLADKAFGTFPFGIGIGLLIALVAAVRDMLRLRDGF
ncbi:MAG: hypothetical protein HGB10_08675 [Coriobacteriia bacterium]|nr:hypothetical protein [Coriobacteriia bacterium]